MVIRTVVVSFVGVALFALLILKNPAITRDVYRFGFFLGVAALLVFVLPWPGQPQMEWVETEAGQGGFAHVSAWLLAIAPLLPFAVLVEAGIAGYRGFSSSLRYGAVALAILGAVGVVASLLIPRLIQR